MKTIKKSSPSRPQVVEKRRGSGTKFTDGSFEFVPDEESDKKLYEKMKTTRNGSLQKTENIYKVSLKASVDSTDPYHDLMQECVRVMAPLKTKDATDARPAEAKVVARTERSTLSLSKDEVVIVTRLGRHEPNPEVQPLLSILTDEQKRQLKLTLTPLDLFTNEVSELCKAISSIGKTK